MRDMRTAAPLTDIELSVPGMVCDGCVERVRKTLMSIPGVLDAKPSAWRKRVAVRYELVRVREDDLRAALATAGFDTARE